MLYTRGFPVLWDKIQGCGTRQFIRCPSYPWQERKYWYREYEPLEVTGWLASKTDSPATSNAPEGSAFNSGLTRSSRIGPLKTSQTDLIANSRTTGSAVFRFNSGSVHPLLGKAIATKAYSGLHAWRSEVDVYALPYLKDHKFQSSEDVVFPGAAYVEMGLVLVLHMFPDVLPRLLDVTFANLLTLSTNEMARFCTRLDTTGRPGDKHGYQITTVEGNGNEIVVSKGLVLFDETFHHCEKGKA